MSLDIIAYDPKETKARKNKFKAKYGISYDKFDDEMIKPRKDMFCYYLHPELLESDIKKYEEMDDDAELIADVDEVDSFHIGYGHFHFLRKELGELVGIRYDDSDVFNTRIYYDDIKEVQELAKYYQNYAEYYHEKATRWHKQSDEDEAERERLIDLMNQIYVLTGHDPEEKADDLAEKLDQIRKLTKNA